MINNVFEFIADSVISCTQIYTESTDTQSVIEDLQEYENPIDHLDWDEEEHCDSEFLYYKCMICDETFKNSNNMLEHLMDHWMKGERA